MLLALVEARRQGRWGPTLFVSVIHDPFVSFITHHSSKKAEGRRGQEGCFSSFLGEAPKMLNRVSQKVKAKVGVSESTTEDAYDDLKAQVKSTRLLCKDSIDAMRDVDKKVESAAQQLRAVHAAFEQFIRISEEGHATKPNKNLALASRQLVDISDECASHVLPVLFSAFEDSRSQVVQYDADLKRLEALREDRDHKRHTFDYHRNELQEKEKALLKQKRDAVGSQSHARKVAKRDETQREYNEANDEAKEAMKKQMARRDGVMANHIQLYLRGMSDMLGSLHKRFSDLHDLTMNRRRTPPPSLPLEPDTPAPEDSALSAAGEGGAGGGGGGGGDLLPPEAGEAEAAEAAAAADVSPPGTQPQLSPPAASSSALLAPVLPPPAAEAVVAGAQEREVVVQEEEEEAAPATAEVVVPPPPPPPPPPQPQPQPQPPQQEKEADSSKQEVEEEVAAAPVPQEAEAKEAVVEAAAPVAVAVAVEAPKPPAAHTPLAELSSLFPSAGVMVTPEEERLQARERDALWSKLHESVDLQPPESPACDGQPPASSSAPAPAAPAPAVPAPAPPQQQQQQQQQQEELSSFPAMGIAVPVPESPLPEQTAYPVSAVGVDIEDSPLAAPAPTHYSSASESPPAGPFPSFPVAAGGGGGGAAVSASPPQAQATTAALFPGMGVVPDTAAAPVQAAAQQPPSATVQATAALFQSAVDAAAPVFPGAQAPAHVPATAAAPVEAPAPVPAAQPFSEQLAFPSAGTAVPAASPPPQNTAAGLFPNTFLPVPESPLPGQTAAATDDAPPAAADSPLQQQPFPAAAVPPHAAHPAQALFPEAHAGAVVPPGQATAAPVVAESLPPQAAAAAPPGPFTVLPAFPAAVEAAPGAVPAQVPPFPPAAESPLQGVPSFPPAAAAAHAASDTSVGAATAASAAASFPETPFSGGTAQLLAGSGGGVSVPATHDTPAVASDDAAAAAVAQQDSAAQLAVDPAWPGAAAVVPSLHSDPQALGPSGSTPGAEWLSEHGDDVPSITMPQMPLVELEEEEEAKPAATPVQVNAEKTLQMQ